MSFDESLGRDDVPGAGRYWTDEGLEEVGGYIELMSIDAGSSFGGGAYRLHTESSAMACQRSILHGFGTLAGPAAAAAGLSYPSSSIGQFDPGVDRQGANSVHQESRSARPSATRRCVSIASRVGRWSTIMKCTVSR